MVNIPPVLLDDYFTEQMNVVQMIRTGSDGSSADFTEGKMLFVLISHDCQAEVARDERRDDGWSRGRGGNLGQGKSLQLIKG